MNQTRYHLDRHEMQEDTSLGFLASGRSRVSYWLDANAVEDGEMKTSFITRLPRTRRKNRIENSACAIGPSFISAHGLHSSIGPIVRSVDGDNIFIRRTHRSTNLTNLVHALPFPTTTVLSLCHSGLTHTGPAPQIWKRASYCSRHVSMRFKQPEQHYLPFPCIVVAAAVTVQVTTANLYLSEDVNRCIKI